MLILPTDDRDYTVEQVDELARRQQRLTELEARFSRLSSNLEEDLNQWQQSALSELSPPVQDTRYPTTLIRTRRMRLDRHNNQKAAGNLRRSGPV